VTDLVRLDRFVVVPVPKPELLPAANTRARVPPAAPSVKKKKKYFIFLVLTFRFIYVNQVETL
jgi:hypothetical protein